MRWLMGLLVFATAGHADLVSDVEQAAATAFRGMPRVVTVKTILGECGADAQVNDQVAYCTSRNVIFVSEEARDLPASAYMVAHLYGHAVQVRHGIADFALEQIRRRRDEEEMLRGLVARQVDCISGFLVARAGMTEVSLTDWFAEEPFAGTHWGRDPLRIGPQVSIGLGARDKWFQLGQGGDLAACAPGEFTSELLMTALR
jgi:predicted metalloprotease